MIKIFLRVTYFLGLLLLVACGEAEEESSKKDLDEQSGEECSDCVNGNVWVKNLFRTHLEGDVKRLKLTASQLIRRQRQGHMMAFNNYDELYIQTLSIDQLVETVFVKFDMGKVIGLSQDSNVLVSNEVLPKVLGNSLNRILADQITINFKPTQKPSIVLTANHAKLLTDSMLMEFQENVSLKAANCEILSESAIWSNSKDGLLLREAYQWNGKSYKSPAFFRVTNLGKCQKIKPVPQIEFVDNLDEIEAKIAESVPMHIRLLFGLVTNFEDVAQVPLAHQ